MSDTTIEDTAVSTSVDAEEAPVKKTRRRRTTKAKADAETAAQEQLSLDIDGDDKPGRATRTRRRSKADADEASEDAEPKMPAKKTKRTRKSTKAEDAPADERADDSTVDAKADAKDEAKSETKAEPKDSDDDGSSAQEGTRRRRTRSRKQDVDEMNRLTAEATAAQGHEMPAPVQTISGDIARTDGDQQPMGRAKRRRNKRNGNNDQQGGNNRRRNRRDSQPTPSVTREELAELKVADLRKRASELGVDGAGLKKAELVEAVYAASAAAEGFRPVSGVVEIHNDGHGVVHVKGYAQSKDDVYIFAQMVRQMGVRAGDLVSGTAGPSRAGNKFAPLVKLETINGRNPEEIRNRPRFKDLTPIYPNEPLRMEVSRETITGRAIDLVAPIGKGQRGLIVSPPKAGKTTILKHICQSIARNNPEVHLFCLLVDERPEEVTDMERSINGTVVASTFDMPADNHTAVSELVIEHAKRLVEQGEDVVVVLDSITRLARAYNLAAPASGRILSGGVDSAALYPPKRFLGAARNIENGGSLTILASALVDTGSKMDEVIFEEFKGTGNMELKLDRELADRRIFPAIDPVASGTRNEDLLIPAEIQPFVWGIRRILANMNNTERAASSMVKGLKATRSNEEFLIRSAKKAQLSEYSDAL